MINRVIFALIIGINDYKTRAKLSGAVSDADDVNDFLINTLGARKGDIINLRDWEEENNDSYNRRGPATRSNIIAQLRSFKENPDIQRGDPIVVYFAGHGTQSQGEIWRDTYNDGFLESLCPVDIGLDEDEEGEVTAIPDYTIRALINELSDAKGDNITLILDCSFSREIDEEVPGERQIANSPVLRPSLDEHLASQLPGGLVKIPGFLGQDLHSHVCLAACSSSNTKRAREIDGRGVFTSTLMEVLTGSVSSKRHLTYVELVREVRERILVRPQTPVLCGVNACRPLFQSDVGNGDPSFISGFTNQNGEFVIRIGESLCIDPGTRFDIYSSNLLDSSHPPLGTLVVTDSQAFTSTLEYLSDSEFSIPPIFFAKAQLISLGICATASEDVHQVVDEILSEYATLERAAIRWPNIPEKSDIRVELEEDHVIFHRCSQEFDQDIISVIGTRIGYTLPKTITPFISDTLRGIAHFNHQLRFNGLMDVSQISLRFYGVSFEDDGFDYQVVPNEEAENVIEGDTVDIIVRPDDDRQFALTIRNDSELDLWPCLFYFDAGTYEIDCWYLPANEDDGQVFTEAPLKKNSSLDTGLSVGRDSPRKFVLSSPSVDAEMGFLKIFFSTSAKSLRFMGQGSPFENRRDTFESCMRQRGFVVSPNQPDSGWGTKTIKMIQRRPQED